MYMHIYIYIDITVVFAIMDDELEIYKKISIYNGKKVHQLSEMLVPLGIMVTPLRAPLMVHIH